MIKLLREYIEDDKRIIEYTKDGETVSHRVTESLDSGSNEDEEIVIPKSPIEELKEENEKLKQEVNSLSAVNKANILALVEVHNRLNVLEGGDE